MGFYERRLLERAEEERGRGRPLPTRRGLNSKVLIRRLENSKRRPGYVPDLLMMHRLITRGPRIAAGEALRLGSLKTKYREEYVQLRIERQGQQELL